MQGVKKHENNLTVIKTKRRKIFIISNNGLLDLIYCIDINVNIYIIYVLNDIEIDNTCMCLLKNLIIFLTLTLFLLACPYSIVKQKF